MTKDEVVGIGREPWWLLQRDQLANLDWGGAKAAAQLAEAGSYLSRASVPDDQAAEKVAQLAKHGLQSSVNLADAAPKNATYLEELPLLDKAFRKRDIETLTPLAKALREILPVPAPAT